VGGSPHLQAGGSSELERLLEAAEPNRTRPLGELIERLEESGRLRAVHTPAGFEGAAGTARPAASNATTGDPAQDAVAFAPVRGIAFDSRRTGSGSVFVAVPGVHADGHEFAAAAADRGACAAIVERLLPIPLVQILVDDSRRALAVAAGWWYGDPGQSLGIVGVTGTDGKTTTSFLTAAVLEAAGISTGLVATAAMKVGAVRVLNAVHVTTPEAPDLQRDLRAMLLAGNEAVVVETTSHGLALGRVAGIQYDIAVFTNLTHEHLELHGTFEAYRDAKLSLFRGLGAGAPKGLARPWARTAIVNRDDPAAALFEAAGREAGARVIGYGVGADAEVRASGIEEDSRGLRFDVATSRWRGAVEVRLAGRFNVHNALAAISVGEALELDPESVRRGLAAVEGVPGRMELIEGGQPFTVVVDYAHSPASLEKVLDLLAPVAAAGGGSLISVFGSAGERDVAKRPMMGRIAAERCRVVVLTDEDPRGEDPGSILEQIAAGARSVARPGGEIECIVDRREAIGRALELARPGDVVLLAGKGHEQSIIRADGPMAWDERREALSALRRLGYSGGRTHLDPAGDLAG